MPHTQARHLYREHLADDIPASIVVFLVALPLCLGIALASGAPLFSGILAGIVGGLLVSWVSGSQLSVTGPAAGLTVIVASAIQSLGSYPIFLSAVVLAGCLQILMGYLRAGVIGAYFPSAVVKGMLAAIGLILILKQIPHAVGYDLDFEGDIAFSQGDQHTTLSELLYSAQAISPGAVLVSAVSLTILLLWETPAFKRWRGSSLIPGPLVVVAWGIAWNIYGGPLFPDLAIAESHLVDLPELNVPGEFLAQAIWPDFSQWQNLELYRQAVTIALIASLESLLSLEAVDKLDPLKRVAPTNRELKAQGLGNVVSGLIGGLPMTAVIVRSSANIQAGGKTRMACFLHGVLLLISVLFFSHALNEIPLACLAAILMVTGYKLCKPQLIHEMHRKGSSQIVPFLVTIAAILLTDLLTGVAIGLAIGIYYVIRGNFHSAIAVTRDGRHYLLRLHKDVSFLNKAPLRQALAQIEDGGYVIIDGSRAQFIDPDILETLEDFMAGCGENRITVELKNIAGLEPAPPLTSTRHAPATGA